MIEIVIVYGFSRKINAHKTDDISLPLGFYKTSVIKSDRFNVDKLMFRSVVFKKNIYIFIYIKYIPKAGLDATSHFLIEVYNL